MEPNKMQFTEEMLTAYLDDELSSAEREIVEQTIAEEPRYAHLLSDLREVRDAVRSLPPPETRVDPVQGVRRRVERLQAAAASTHEQRVQRFGRVTVLATAACLVVAIGTYLLRSHGPALSETDSFSKSVSKSVADNKPAADPQIAAPLVEHPQSPSSAMHDEAAEEPLGSLSATAVESARPNFRFEADDADAPVQYFFHERGMQPILGGPIYGRYHPTEGIPPVGIESAETEGSATDLSADSRGMASPRRQLGRFDSSDGLLGKESSFAEQGLAAGEAAAKRRAQAVPSPRGRGVAAQQSSEGVLVVRIDTPPELIASQLVRIQQLLERQEIVAQPQLAEPEADRLMGNEGPLSESVTEPGQAIQIIVSGRAETLDLLVNRISEAVAGKGAPLSRVTLPRAQQSKGDTVQSAPQSRLLRIDLVPIERPASINAGSPAEQK